MKEMFNRSSRYQLALSLAALLSLGTAFGAAADSSSEASAITAAATVSAPVGSDLVPQASLDSVEIVMPLRRQTGPEGLAPTRFNKTTDRGE
jgi:hypothetical protein